MLDFINKHEMHKKARETAVTATVIKDHICKDERRRNIESQVTRPSALLFGPQDYELQKKARHTALTATLNSIDQYQYRYHAHLHQQEEEAKNAEEGSSRCSDSHLHQVYGQKSHRQVLNTTTVLGLTATTSFINKKMRKTQKKIRHAATVLKFMVQDHWSRLARQLPQPTVLKINGQRPPRRRLQLIKVTTLKSRPMSSPPSSIPAIDKQISSSDRKTSAKINQLQLSSSSITTKVAIMRNFITTKVDKMQKKARHTALTATVVNFLERPRPPRRT